MITGGASTSPVLAQPYGIAVDADGRVLVADTYAQAIHVFDTARNRYSAVRVTAKALIGVAVFRDTLVVTDSAGQRVICLTPKGKVLWSLGKEAGFERPTGVVAADDRVYVADTLAARIVTVSRDGKVLGTFGSRGGGPGQFNFPTNIARDPNGRLVVTDSMNFRVQIFEPDGRFLGAFGELGDGAGDFNRPKGVAFDSDGHVYVVEGLHDSVQIFDDAGRFLLAFGESGAGDGQFWLPSGIAIRDDLIYVADAANKRVQVFRYLKESR
jgi:DNA-binding beta-propeller fold protein YncE